MSSFREINCFIVSLNCAYVKSFIIKTGKRREQIRHEKIFRKNKKTFQKGIDNLKKSSIILSLPFEVHMREWRNWQTRTFEGRVVHTVRVQVPFPAPDWQSHKRLPILLRKYAGMAERATFSGEGRTQSVLLEQTSNVSLLRRLRAKHGRGSLPNKSI